MLKQLRHKRFIKTMMIDMPLSPRCYWCAQPTGSIVPLSAESKNDGNNDHQRPDHVQT